jgi:hypothetical protein
MEAMMRRILETLSIGAATVALAACSSTSDGGSPQRMASAAPPPGPSSTMSASPGAAAAGTTATSPAPAGQSAAAPTPQSAAAPTPMTAPPRTGTAASGTSRAGAGEMSMTGASGASARYDMDNGNAEGSRATRALNMLMARGYGDYSDFKPQGDNFTATVDYQGRRTPVLIDPGAGKITAYNDAGTAGGGAMSGSSTAPSGTMMQGTGGAGAASGTGSGMR